MIGEPLKRPKLGSHFLHYTAFFTHLLNFLSTISYLRLAKTDMSNEFFKVILCVEKPKLEANYPELRHLAFRAE